MLIINSLKLILKDFTKVDEYSEIYKEVTKERPFKRGHMLAFYKEKLNNIREIESIRLFEVEKDKLDEILEMTKSLEDYPTLSGVTKLLIEDDNGYSIYEDYPKFKKELYSAMVTEVNEVYDDIENNIDGSFGSFNEIKKGLKKYEICKFKKYIEGR